MKCEALCKADEVAYTVKEVSETLTEAKQDLQDVGASGIRGVFTGEEVECSSEIRSEAENIISKSNDKYGKKYKYIQDKLQTLEKTRQELFEEKKKIAHFMNRERHCSICVPTEIAAFRMEQPKTIKPDSALMELFFIPMEDPITNTLLKYARSSKRLEEAREYREEAKDYAVKIDKEIAKLKDLDIFAEKILGIFAEEKEVLKALNKSLRMDRSIKDKSAVESLETLLAESILNKDGRTNKKYEAAIHEIRECQIMCVNSLNCHS